jgi:hypothetical protein
MPPRTPKAGSNLVSSVIGVGVAEADADDDAEVEADVDEDVGVGVMVVTALNVVGMEVVRVMSLSPEWETTVVET